MIRRLPRLLAAALLCTPCGLAAGDLVVVPPPRPSPRERLAAEELVRLLAPITREPVRLGRADAAAGGYVLVSVEGSSDAPSDAAARAALERELRAHPALPAEAWAALARPGGSDYAVTLATLRFFAHGRRLLERPAIADALRRRGMRTSQALYLPSPPVLARLLPAVLRLLPPGGRLHLLPAYGARAVSDQLAAWGALRDASVEPALVTWLEFDGSMFLPQAWTRALHDGAQAASALPFSAVYANHWRVSGLEADAWMFAETAWRRRPYAELIREYLGRVYGNEAVDEARAAQEALEEATLHAHARLFNVGFCWETYYHRPYPEAELARSRQLFTAAAEAFARLAGRAGPDHGRRRARMLAGRCQAANTCASTPGT